MTLDDAIDELYGAGLDAFVPLRSKLVRELRAQGDRAEAEALARTRVRLPPGATLRQRRLRVDAAGDDA